MNVDKIAKWFVDKSPAIFTGFAIMGTVTTTALAIEATPSAMDKLDEAYLEKGGQLNKKEVVKATWKCYVPAIVSGTATIAFIFAANYSHVRKETAMAATAAFFEKRYYDYKDKVIELDGEDKDREIETDLALDKMVRNPSKKKEISGDEILCYEPNTEQYFITSAMELTWAKLTANKILSMQEKVTLNEILALFPDANHKHEIGNKLGWYMDEDYYEFVGYNWGYYGRPWLDIIPTYTDVNGERVGVIHFTINPVKEEAYNIEEMLTFRDKVKDELSVNHIYEEVEAEKAKSQK